MMDNYKQELIRKTNNAYELLEKEISSFPIGRICHYTSKTAFANIIENNKLWFTYYQDFKDKMEGRLINKLLFKSISRDLNPLFRITLKKRINNKSKEYNKAKYYICCFTTNNDSKKMWKYYTKRKDRDGCNFEFNADEIYTVIRRQSEGTTIYNSIIYSKKDAVTIIRKVIKEYYSCWYYANNDYDKECVIDYLFDTLELFRFVFKNKKYRWENEKRIIIIRWNNKDEVQTNKKRHIEIDIGKKDNYNSRGINISPYVTDESKNEYQRISKNFGNWCKIKEKPDDSTCIEFKKWMKEFNKIKKE